MLSTLNGKFGVYISHSRHLGEESTPAKPSKSASSTQEVPTTPSYPDWSNSMQAYYGAGASPPPFFASTVPSPTPHPYIWGSQHPLIPPYGTPVPYPALYPAGGLYAHPNMTMTPNSAQINTELEGKAADGKDRASAQKSKGTSAGKAGESAKATSGSGNDGASLKVLKVVAMAPQMQVMRINRNLLQIRWEVSIRCLQMDERELKRQKRKQSNRESARRSRLRKQAECEELQARVENLTNDSRSLREELRRVSEECEKLKSENDSIKEELTRLYGPDAVANLEQSNHSSVVQSHGDEENS
ncbi:hypothetical protein GH714_031415 [Hevea brasiliensis]|uniref:BZIP domain-containing protein n=1 Tax=Hevea brasiliensis TaxID=3981 RepID=A0A6A6L2E5_HEVBR|nr:hypothetical protein GH714_031415 [Hevea brasiliensis]